jgi:hypothetical protein
MMGLHILLLAAFGSFASYASASSPPQATPAAAVEARAPTPSTLTLAVPIFPTAPGGPTSEETFVITLNPTPNGGPAFTAPPPGVFPEPAVPDDTPPCSSLDALVSSCTTQTSFYGLPLSAQAQCLCNVGPWDSVVSACFDHLTVLGQYYASSLKSHGLLGLCSTYGAGPTWPTSTIARVSATSTPTATVETSTVESSKVGATGNTGGSATPSSTQSVAQSSTQSPVPGSGSHSLAWPSLLVWLLPWLLAV